MKRPNILLVLFLFLLSGTNVRAQYVSGIENGDFEGDDFSSFFYKANADVNPVPNVTENDILEEANGNHFLKITSSEGAEHAWDSQFFIYLNEPLSAGDKISLSMRVKADRETRASSQAHGEPGAYIHWSMVGTVNFTTEWEEFTYEGTISPNLNGCQSITFNLNDEDLNNSTDFYFDDIIVTVEKAYIPDDDEYLSVVTNGDFTERDYTSFFYKENGGDVLSVTDDKLYIDVPEGSTTGNPCLNITSMEGAQNSWDTQFYIKLNEPLKKGDQFKFNMRAKASQSATISTEAHTDPGSYINWGILGSIALTTEWKDISYEGTITEDFAGCQTIVFTLNQNLADAIDFYFDDIDLKIYVNPYIEFSDTKVKALCVTNWDTNEDGKLSCAEAAAVETLGSVFKNNTTITKFDELQYFTGLTSIGSSAFQGCNKLSSIIIPSSVTSIGNHAFDGCTSLRDLPIHENITSIGSYAFAGWSGLSSISIPSSVTTIGAGAFSDWSDLIEVYCNPTDVPTTSSSAFDGTPIGDAKLYVPEESLDDYKAATLWNDFMRVFAIGAIPQFSVNSISVPDNIMAGERVPVIINVLNETQATDLVALSLWVQQAGSSQWTWVAGETSTVDPGETGNIVVYYQPNSAGSYTLKVTGNDPDVSLKEQSITVNDIQQWTDNESGLRYSYVPGSGEATVIENESSAYQMTSVTIPASVTIDDATYAVKTIGEQAFMNCNNLETVVLSEGLEIIENQAFFGDWKITDLTMPSSLKRIGDQAFGYCDRLKSFTLSEGLQTIGKYVFTNCQELTTVLSRITDPAQVRVSNYSFMTINWNQSTQQNEVIPLTATLYVPKGTVSDYQAITGWNQFKAIKEGEAVSPDGYVSYIVNGNFEGDDFSSFVYGLYGEDLANVTEQDLIVDDTNDNHRYFTITSKDGAEYQYDTQFFIKLNEPLNAGDKVRFSMRAKASNATTVNTQAHREPGGYITYKMFGSFDLTTDWDVYYYEGTITSDQQDCQTIAFMLNVDPVATEFYFDDINVMVYKYIEPSDDEYESYITNGDFEDDSDFSSFVYKVNASETLSDVTTQDLYTDAANDNRYFTITSLEDAEYEWDTQFFVKLKKPLKTGDRIKFSMLVKASEEASLASQAHAAPGEYKYYSMVGSPSITTGWEEYAYEGTVSEDQDGCQTIAFNLNINKDDAIEFCFDDISVMVYSDPNNQTDPGPGPIDPEPNGVYVSYIENGDLEGTNYSNFRYRLVDVEEDAITDDLIVVDGDDADNHCLKLESLENVENTWDSQFYIVLPEGKKLAPGTKVKFSMRAKADQDTFISTQGHETVGTYLCWGIFGNINVTTDWQTVGGVFIVPNNDDPATTGEVGAIAFDLNQNKDDAITFYFDDISLLVDELVNPEPDPDDGYVAYMSNGTFENADYSSFAYNLYGEDLTDVTVQNLITDNNNGNHYFTITSRDGAANAWDTQFFIKLDEPLTEGDKVKFRMRAKASKATRVSTQAHAEPGRYLTYRMLGSFNLTTDWQDFTYEGTVFSDQNGCQTILFTLNEDPEAIDFYFDNISVRVLKPYIPTDEEYVSLITNGDFQDFDFSSFAYQHTYQHIEGTITPTSDVTNDDILEDATNGNRYITITSLEGAEADWDTQFFVKLKKPLKTGDRIKFSMRVKANEETSLASQAHAAPGEYKYYSMVGSPSITTNWEEYAYEGVVSEDQDGCQTIALNLNVNTEDAIEFWFDDIVVKAYREGGFPEDPEPPVLEDNRLYSNGAEVCVGRTSVDLAINMANEDAITAFEFDVALPTGVTVTGCSLSDRKTDAHSISYQLQANGNYKITALSTSNTAFSGEDGALVNLKLQLPEDMEPGEYPIQIKNIELATATKAFNPSDYNATLSIVDFITGDANGDGKVSIFDAVQVVNYILGNNPENFIVAAADVDGNGRITIFDAVSIVNIILNQNANQARKTERSVFEDIEPE